MKIDKGVMVMKEGKAWGVIYVDGHCTNYGWVEPENAILKSSLHCTSVDDFTHRNSSYQDELRTGKLMYVERRTDCVFRDFIA